MGQLTSIFIVTKSKMLIRLSSVTLIFYLPNFFRHYLDQLLYCFFKSPLFGEWITFRTLTQTIHTRVPNVIPSRWKLRSRRNKFVDFDSRGWNSGLDKPRSKKATARKQPMSSHRHGLFLFCSRCFLAFWIGVFLVCVAFWLFEMVSLWLLLLFGLSEQQSKKAIKPWQI